MDRDGTQRLIIAVSLESQRLDVLGDGATIVTFPVSTSKFGAGEVRDTFRTPRGRHVVRAKIGTGQPLGAVFRGRRPTGEIYTPAACR